MPYMPMPDEQTAMAVSRAINSLSIPIGEKRGTLYALAWQTTPDGKVWMQCAAGYPFPVAQGHESSLADILAGFVQAGHLSQASADQIMALVAQRLIEANGGFAHVTLNEVTPPEWIAALVSDEAFAAVYPPPESEA